jgi:hypothetical protein
MPHARSSKRVVTCRLRFPESEIAGTDVAESVGAEFERPAWSTDRIDNGGFPRVGRRARIGEQFGSALTTFRAEHDTKTTVTNEREIID